MKMTRRAQRVIAAAALLGTSFAGVVQQNARAIDPVTCTKRVLVLSAMPLELNPLVSKATIDQVVRVPKSSANDRTFYVGTLASNDVVLAMSGIGLVNATETTQAAFQEFGDCFSAVVFSGVAGSYLNIGDVAIPRTWTHDTDKLIWFDANPGMLRTAGGLQATDATKANYVALSQSVPVGDAACLCPGVDAPTPVTMPEPLKLVVGGDGVDEKHGEGTSYDTFGNRSVPCLPGGGDIAGCRPCVTQPGFDEDAGDFAENMPKLIDPDFFAGLFAFESTTEKYASQDEETAAVADVAKNYFGPGHAIPFLGIRAASDGQNDPLHLPGFPAQFAVYRQLAGNNAAAVTIAFLAAWGQAGRPIS
jgi:nucleoside phosphorylase